MTLKRHITVICSHFTSGGERGGNDRNHMKFDTPDIGHISAIYTTSDDDDYGVYAAIWLLNSTTLLHKHT